MNRKMKIIFTLSIILNLALGGLAAGMASKCWDRKGPPRNLSAEGKEIVRAAFESGREDIRPLILEMRESRKEMEKIVKNDTFDRQAYEKAAQEMTAIKDKFSQRRADKMGDIFEKLSAEDREKMYERFVKKFGHGRKYQKKHDSGESGEDDAK